MIVRTAQAVVFFLFSISLLAGLVTGSTLYFRLSYLWGFLILTSWLMSFFSLKNVNVRRSTRSLRSQVGQIFEEQFEVRNTSKIPKLWLEVKDNSTLPGTKGSQVLTLIGKGEGRYYIARTRLTQRGVFHLGPTELYSGDLFGLFPKQREFLHNDTLLVYPLVVEILDFPNPPGLLPGGEELRRRTQQITPNASGVREYVTGDPLNRIHWLSTARRNRLMVKEFELDPLADVWIFLDAYKSVHSTDDTTDTSSEMQEVWNIRRYKYTLPPSTLEYAVSTAASLARFYLQRDRAVGLVTEGPNLQILPCDRGGRQLNKILETLALVKSEGFLPLHALVEAQARHLPRGSTVVIITPSSSESVYRISDILLRRGLRPVAVLIDGSTFGNYTRNQLLVESMKSLGIPVCKLDYGDDLSSSLSTVLRPSIIQA
jgi:uncharacterized protein (DUF58 family)